MVFLNFFSPRYLSELVCQAPHEAFASRLHVNGPYFEFSEQHVALSSINDSITITDDELSKLSIR